MRHNDQMRRGLGLVLFLILALVGCSRPPQTVGGEPRQQRPVSAVSLSPSTTELLMGYAYDLQPLGRTQACNFPAGLDPIPVMATVKPDYEKIAAAKPSIVLYDASLYNPSDIEKIKQLGIATYEHSVKSLDDFYRACAAFGQATGSETRMSEYADKVRVAAAENENNAPSRRSKVMVVLADATGEYMVAGLKTFQADVVKNSAGIPVGPDSDRFVTMNIESLIQMAPEVIITNGNAARILKDPRLATVPAVKNKRVVDIDGDILLRAGSRVENLLKELGAFLRLKYEQS